MADEPIAAARADGHVDLLLQRIARGDQDALAELYDDVAARVFGLARRITADRATAEEVTQDVMVEVWRTAPRFDPDLGSGIGWLLLLTHRRSVDRVRDAAARQRREERAAAQRLVTDEIDDAIQRDAEHAEVRGALEGLSELQREAIELAYFGGHTYREVADLLDVPEGTAKTRLRDGVRRLRRRLGGSS